LIPKDFTSASFDSMTPVLGHVKLHTILPSKKLSTPALPAFPRDEPSIFYLTKPGAGFSHLVVGFFFIRLLNFLMLKLCFFT